MSYINQDSVNTGKEQSNKVCLLTVPVGENPLPGYMCRERMQIPWSGHRHGMVWPPPQLYRKSERTQSEFSFSTRERKEIWKTKKKKFLKKKKRNVKINKENQKETKRNKENQKSEAHEKAKTVAAQSLALIVNSPLLSWLAAPLHSTTLHSHSLFHSLSQLWLKINT